jgi:hypothetical protein
MGNAYIQKNESIKTVSIYFIIITTINEVLNEYL